MARHDSQFRDDRLDIRISTQAKSLFQRAAQLTGQSLSTFVTECACERARQILGEHAVIVLNDQARDLLLNSLQHPPAPNAALRHILQQQH